MVDSEAEVNSLNDELKNLTQKAADQCLLEELKFEKETLSRKIDELINYNDELKMNTDKIKTDFQQENAQLFIKYGKIIYKYIFFLFLI